MKPFHILGGVAAVTALTGGFLGIRAKLAYDADGRAIDKLMAEYKALGVLTDGGRLIKRIPSEENAWPDIEPMLLKHLPTGWSTVYKSALAFDFVMACDKRDLPLMHRYLNENRAKRDKVSATIMAKPKLQVRHDYDEGYMMLLPEFSVLRALTREYFLSAYVAGLEGNLPEVQRNFMLANRLISFEIDRPEYTSVVFGGAMRKNMIQTALRIIEANPSMAEPLQKQLSAPDMRTSPNLQSVFLTEFIAQISLARYFDVSEMDRPTIPSFLRGIFKVPNEQDIMKMGSVKHGGYVPTTRSMRSFFRNRLEAWKPFFAQDKGELPPLQTYVAANSLSRPIPAKLGFMVRSAGPNFEEQMFHGIGFADEYFDLGQVIFRALEVKRQTGEYPSSLQSTGIEVRTRGGGKPIIYEKSGNTVSVHDDLGSLFPFDSSPGISFPATAIVSTKQMDDHRKSVSQYRTNSILISGVPTSRLPKPVLKVP